MERKNLEKIIVLGLLLSSSMYSTAWADNALIDENGKLIVESSGTVEPNSKFNIGGEEYELSDFDTIEIHMTADNLKDDNPDRALGVYSARYDLSGKDVTVYVDGGGYGNNDGLHFTNHGPYFYVRNYTAIIDALGSDAINLSRDNTMDATVIVEEDLNVHIKQNGNGIRANASIYGNIDNPNVASITVTGDTYIRLDGDASNLAGAASGESINPTAVWAGSDANSLTAGQKAQGKGEVYLKGNTVILLNGNGKDNGFLEQLLGGGKVYGILTGKNGYVQVNNLDLTANGNYSYGIAATEKNVTYNSDNTVNNFGSVIELNGEINNITMNGNNSYAIYAQGKDINNNSNTVKSSDNGIGNLDVKGDIVATNSGKIDLTVNKVADITGDIEATNSGIINFTLGDNADMIVSEKDNTLINAGGVSKLSLAKDGNESKIGNVQAANGGTINLTLGDGAYFAGRVDDYKDAGEGNDNNNAWNNQEHKNVFDQEFAKNVTSSGTVNMTLGNNSTWFVTEQSWATTVNTNDSIIDLTNGANQNYAVHIGTLKGKAKFIVNLDPNTDAVENNGNMIYVYNGTEAKDLNLQINNEREVLTGLANGEKLRFATVANAGHGFGDIYVARGRGVINSGFSIEYEKYNTNNEKENDKYNGGTDFDETKPGSDYVDGIYGNGENVYLVRDTSKDAGKSDSGATIINMSRANYKNAIYMDRLNKRMGEMRYVNGEEEQGLWVRLRHDRIGQSGDFRSMNTMYELGYDVKQPTTSGEHRIGMAIDYMDGSTTYDDILGKGETKRYGLWLYDTWLGEKGHYTDYIVKWGHLSNEFDIRDKDSFEHIVGDYSNNVFSVSAEYGKKNDMGNNWYFEPQAQLQLARVTGADYVTTQGSRVSVDGINSLIGRAGFRIGRDMNENSTVYLKADLLHEFMGDQTVTAADATGTLREEFDNKGTWYDVGFGFAAKMSKNSYAFLDFERSFGNDNDETYQINAGLQWSF